MNYQSTHYDYLIVGQGLAGTILSYMLIKEGKRVLVINEHNPDNASYVACGIFTPIAGQRLAKIWQADEIVPFLPDFYRRMEQETGLQFFYPLPYTKILVDQELESFAARRLADPEYKNLIRSTSYCIGAKSIAALEIAHAGRIDTKVLLDGYRIWLKTKNAYLEARFDDKLCSLTPEGIQYKDIFAKRLIFCNGLEAGNNKFFPETRFYPTKGEILTVHIPENIDRILCGNVFLSPIGNNLYHVGATFARTFEHLLPTPEGEAWLREELEKIISSPYTIVAHRVGVRPTTPGHRPIYKWHETLTEIGVFTGFGAKGTSYIPYCALKLLENSL